MLTILLYIVTLGNKERVYSLASSFERWSANIMMLDNHHLEGVVELERTSQMFFEDIPIALMQVAIVQNILQCEDLREDKFLVYFTLFKAVVNLLIQFYVQLINSRATGQGLILQCL